MPDILYKTEHDLEEVILDFQKKFGIVDEKNIVTNDDYEFTLDFSLSGKETAHE